MTIPAERDPLYFLNYGGFFHAIARRGNFSREEGSGAPLK
jgi:hypothetical protein